MCIIQRYICVLYMSSVNNKKQDGDAVKNGASDKQKKVPLLEGLFSRAGRKTDTQKKKGVLGEMQRKVPGNKRFPTFVNILVWIAIIYLALSLGIDRFNEREIIEPTISEVVSSVQAGEVSEIIVRGQKVRVTYVDEKVGELRKDSIASFDETLLNLGVTAEQLVHVGYSVKKETGFGYWIKTLLPFLFPLLILGFLYLVPFPSDQGYGWYAGVSIRAGAGAICQP